MTKADLVKEIEGMKSTLLLMESRIEELEAAPSTGSGEMDVATPNDLIYILRTQGMDAYDAARKQRNRAIRERMKHNAPRPPLTLSGGEKQREAA